MPRRWTRRDYAIDPESLARALLGQVLVRHLPATGRLSGRIVETEAYLGVPDRAAHSFGARRTARTEPMYAHGGTAYVYFTYGMHHCFNVVAGVAGDPVAVLVRALEPLEGLGAMRLARAGRSAKPVPDRLLCSGPARLCQAMSIDRALSGIDLATSPDLFIERAPPVDPAQIHRGPRIGVDYAGDWALRPLRFWVSDSAHVSR